MSNILTWFGDGLDLLLGYMDQRNIPVYRESESPNTSAKPKSPKADRPQHQTCSYCTDQCVVLNSVKDILSLPITCNQYPGDCHPELA